MDKENKAPNDGKDDKPTGLNALFGSKEEFKASEKKKGLNALFEPEEESIKSHKKSIKKETDSKRSEALANISAYKQSKSKTKEDHCAICLDTK